jgi:predicted RNA binding protein YcfA (HicA-like mRNA interferase family)
VAEVVAACLWNCSNRPNVSDSVLFQVLRGTSDANIRFADLCGLLSRLGFAERIKGSHHVFSHEKVAEILNLQPKNSFAKPYQVKQVRKILVQYKLGEGAQ